MTGNVGETTAHSTAALRAAVLERAGDVDPLYAVGLLADRTYPEKRADLVRTLAEAGHDVRVRHHAAVALGRSGGEEAVPDLVAALGDVEQPFVVRGVVRGLAYTGSPDAFEPVTAHLAAGSAPVRRDARWAATHLAYLNGIDDGPALEGGDRVDVDAGAATDITIGPATDAAVEAALGLAPHLLRGRRLAAASVATLECGDVRLVAGLTEDVLTEPDAILRHRTVAGAVGALDDVEDTGWYPRYVLYTQPSGRDVAEAFVVVAGSTVVHHQGEISPTGDGLRVTLRTVRSTGVRPLELEAAVGATRPPEGSGIVGPNRTRVRPNVRLQTPPDEI